MPEPPASPAPEVIDLVRVELTPSDELRCTIVVNALEDPSQWGLVLADLARVVAQKFQEFEGRDPKATLRAIRDGFDEELNSTGPGERPNG
jgi:hypothetical protein